eukprot:11197082-Lingulodinium_polyedra.AAC.1
MEYAYAPMIIGIREWNHQLLPFIVLAVGTIMVVAVVLLLATEAATHDSMSKRHAYSECSCCELCCAR